VNGSDYPLPAVNLLIRMRPLVKQGYINADEADSLKEIYDYNPLLFDFVLKRTLKLPGTSKGFPASIFMTNPSLPV
jgi:mannonate dehydratase